MGLAQGKQAKPFTAPNGRVIFSRGILARQIGVSTGFVSYVLSGRKRLSFERGLRMAAVLGCSPVELWVYLYGEQGIVPEDSPVRRKLASSAARALSGAGSGSNHREPR